MQIIEIYKSLQGESSFTGLPCVFVRLAGCNLRCHWCDSEYTFKGGTKMSNGEVAAEVRRLMPGGGLVEITGGEPLLQERELIPLMKQLVEGGYTLLLETSGERPLQQVPPAVFKIVDVKCPDSGEGESFRLENLGAVSKRDEFKFVIASRTDYEFAREFTLCHELWQKVGNVIFSPAFRKQATGSRDVANCLLDPRDLAEWILQDGLRVRLGLQIHKFIWDPLLRGV
jgi:7-carboxy-7-deazaguanine synthase